MYVRVFWYVCNRNAVVAHARQVNAGFAVGANKYSIGATAWQWRSVFM